LLLCSVQLILKHTSLIFLPLPEIPLCIPVLNSTTLPNTSAN
jgi:hypothetical protein